MTKETNTKDNFELALEYNAMMPDRIREYLHTRGLTDPAIARFRIGWNGARITIPITNHERKVVFFKLAENPQDTPSPQTTASIDHAIELYGWERIHFKRSPLIICEDEWERLILEGHSFAALSSTGGMHIFLPEWVEQLDYNPQVYICFRTGSESYDAAGGIHALIPESKVVRLPDSVGMNGGIEDFFVRCGASREDFQRLLDEASDFNNDDRETI